MNRDRRAPSLDRGAGGVDLRSWWPRLLKAVIVLLPVWIGFLYLIRAQPVDPANALIMVWLTALVMILACLPEIFALFKRVKWGDVELELRDTLRDADSEFHTIQNLDDRFIFTLKKGLDELADLVKRIATRPETPVLMKIDVGHGQVSWPVLYTYVIVLETLGAPIRLLFLDSSEATAASGLSQRRPRHMPVSNILGVLSGRRFLIVCQSRWPALKMLLLSVGWQSHQNLASSEELGFDSHNLARLCDRVRAVMERDFNDLQQLGVRLSCQQFQEWLADEADRLIVDVELGSRDLGVIEKALRQRRKFLIAALGSEFHSVVAVCTLTRHVALETLGRAESRR